MIIVTIAAVDAVDDDADVTLPLSLSSAHLFPSAKFGHTQQTHTLPGNDLYPVYVVWICTFPENGFLLL